MPAPLIHVFLGANAQYIKTAPLLRLMDERGVPYRLVDSGQHVELAARVRRELGIREPDHAMSSRRDVNNVAQAVAWSARLATQLPLKQRLRGRVFGGADGICVVHGDTPTTLLSALLARRAGLRIAHLEAGLRSHRLLHPFPEEGVRLAVMRMSDVLFAPDDTAERNLHQLRLRGEIVRVSGNTGAETLRSSLGAPPMPGSGPVVVTMHRVENLHSASRTDGLLRLVTDLARTREVVFVVHGPTADTLSRRGLLAPLQRAGVTVVPLLPYSQFTRMLAAAAFVITDGGSVQEECALLGTPTLVWRLRTERPDGLGSNVVLANDDEQVVRAFVSDPDRLRRPPTTATPTPSAEVLETLLARLQPASAVPA